MIHYKICKVGFLYYRVYFRFDRDNSWYSDCCFFTLIGAKNYVLRETKQYKQWIFDNENRTFIEKE